MKKIILTLCIACLMSSTAAAAKGPVSGEWLYGRLWGGLGILSGDVTYQIGGHATNPSANYWFPLSELRWPLNVTVLTLGGEIPLGPDLEACGVFSKNLSGNAGKMQDSDWLNAANTTAKTIYSESDTALQSITADVDLRGWLSGGRIGGGIGLGFGIGGGLLYERFSWDASNVDQWYPQRPDLPHDRVSGLIGTYRTTVTMPYVEVMEKLTGKGDWAVMVRGGYSPVAAVSDEDDHILRQIRATTDLSGNAYKATLEGRCALSRNWFLSARWDIISFDIKGVEHDYVYGNVDNNQGDSWTIEHKVSSTQYNLSLTAGWRFD